MNARFPKDFVWGVAAASYQIEGANPKDGCGPSVWDAFCTRKRAIRDLSDGSVACDHYNRSAEDVALMAGLGAGAYRFSISWPRVMPEGQGAINEPGLDFYDRLVDDLLANGIAPWVTLFHWDYPLALFRRGGWLSPDSPRWFADFTAVVCDRLSDRVSHWITINEYQCFLGLGHVDGTHAPGLQLPTSEFLLATHHALLAHGLSTQVLRARAKRPPVIGCAPVGFISMPETDSPEDIAAAREATVGMRTDSFWNNAWYADPMLKGMYPEAGLAHYGKAMPKIGQGDMETICQPLDFYGVNIYQGGTVRRGADGGIEDRPRSEVPLGAGETAMNWPITPPALYWGPKFLYERYGLPIVVTENGMANADVIMGDGQVHDPQRIDFLRNYLRELRRAANDGVAVAGYFQWSILDNFEWAYGYSRRFGLVYVDYPTQRRIPKDSYHWYRAVIASGGAALDVDDFLSLLASEPSLAPAG
ncbi:MAG: GH1 family beta-glucosidase [Sumerlaeia bacterium]